MTASSFSDIKLSPGMQAFFRRWFNFHRVIWLLTLAIFFLAWNRGLALLYGLFSLLVAMLLISNLLPRWQLRGVRASRSLPKEFTVGESGAIDYRLEADGTRLHVTLCEPLPFIPPNEQRLFFDRIARKAAGRLRFTCRQRGCYLLENIRLSCAYPFGIVACRKTIDAEPTELLVYPRVVELPRPPLPIVADVTTRGDAQLLQRGGRDEFVGVREYCPGDELSRIHWTASARHRQLVVKEYAQTDRPALVVVLDCRSGFDVGRGNVSSFELAVTLAASMIRCSSREGMPCHLVYGTDRLRKVSVPAFSSEFSTLYAALARLTCDSRLPYPLLVEQAQRRYPRANLIATFRLDTDTVQPRLPRQVTQIVMEMETQSFDAPETEAESIDHRREGNRLIYRLQAHSRLESLFR